MATEFVAISTTNAQMSGWNVLARGADKATVEQQADASIVGTDIYADTLRKNLRIVSKTTARRMAGRCALGECAHEHGAE